MKTHTHDYRGFSVRIFKLGICHIWRSEIFNATGVIKTITSQVSQAGNLRACVEWIDDLIKSVQGKVI